jgi:CBS domain-containing protein
MSSSEFDEEYDTESQRTISAFIFSEPLGHVPRRKTVTVKSTATVEEAIAAMNENHVGCALIVEASGKLVGIFTERDVLTKVAGRKLDLKVKVDKVMTAAPFTLPPSASIGFALAKMTDEGYRHIPLVKNDGKPAGVIAVRDIVAWLVEFMPSGLHNLPPSIALPKEEGGG